MLASHADYSPLPPLRFNAGGCRRCRCRHRHSDVFYATLFTLMFRHSSYQQHNSRYAMPFDDFRCRYAAYAAADFRY